MKILLLTIIGILFSCSSDGQNQAETIDMRVNHFQSTGIGEGLFLTLLIQQNNTIGADNWTRFYDSIEGFNYQSGFIYDLKVLVEPVNDPPADGSSVKYTLQEITTTQEVSNETTFNIDLKTNGQSFITTTSDYKLLDQIEIDCTTLCTELDEKLQNQESVIGTFKHLQGNKIQLTELK